VGSLNYINSNDEPVPLKDDEAQLLLKEGIYVIGFFYPVVPKDEARIRVQHRKIQHHLNDTICCGKLEVDLASQQCHYDQEPIHLTRLEWLLLKQLALNIGRIVSKEQLENACYGWNGENESNSVEVHMHHLRKKLSPDLIKTIRGLGYILKEDLK